MSGEPGEPPQIPQTERIEVVDKTDEKTLEQLIEQKKAILTKQLGFVPVFDLAAGDFVFIRHPNFPGIVSTEHQQALRDLFDEVLIKGEKQGEFGMHKDDLRAVLEKLEPELI